MKINAQDLLLCVFAIGGFWTSNWFPFILFAIILILAADKIT